MPFTNKVSWAVEPDRCALLIHDMQTHYLNALGEDQRSRLVARVRAIGVACTSRDIPIFASQVPPTRQGRERGLMLDMWGGGPAAAGQALDPDLDLDSNTIRPLTKRSYSAFYGNDFEVMLRRLGRDSIVIVGVYTSIGCQYTAVDAFMRDIRPFVVADATADFSAQEHDAGLAGMARTCARIVDADSLLKVLAAPARGP